MQEISKNIVLDQTNLDVNSDGLLVISVYILVVVNSKTFMIRLLFVNVALFWTMVSRRGFFLRILACDKHKLIKIGFAFNF